MNYYRVGIYLRLSNEDNNKINKYDDSESIKNQRNLLIRYIKEHDDFVLYDEYCDENISGAGAYRSEFERLIKDCKNHKIDIVLCKSQSRFSRDIEIVERYINNLFIEWNIRFISVVDGIDTKNIENKKARQINGLVNEWFLEDVSNNIRSALKIKMIKGECISPFAPYGYILKDNKLFIDKNVSKIIIKIFNLFLEGYSYTKIANILNNNKVPSPSLYKYTMGSKLNIRSSKKRSNILWNCNAIKNILTNEVYIGNLNQGKRTTVSYKNHKIILKDNAKWIKNVHTHKAIVDIKVFNKVQSIIKLKSKNKIRISNTHVLSGKVYCLKCNSTMKKKNSSMHEYLTCSNSYCENHKSIRYDLLNNILLKEINNLISKYYNKNQIIKIVNNNNLIKEINKKKNSIIHELENNKLILENLYKDKINKTISNNEYCILLNRFNSNYDKLIKELKKCNSKSKKINQYIKKLNNQNFIEQINIVIINKFIKNIYINNVDNKIIKIIWNI